jgi:hypothetical protein
LCLFVKKSINEFPQMAIQKRTGIGVISNLSVLYIYITGGIFNNTPLSTKGLLFPNEEMRRDKMYHLL